MENIKIKAIELLFDYGFRLAGAIVVLVTGFVVINMIVGTLDKTLKKRKIDLSLHSFIKSVFSFISKTIIIIVAAAIMGFPIATFIAPLSAAGLAIGLALRDSLSNFAGGILILIFRPFGVGDFIDIQGYSGTVKEIQLLYTSLNTPDNRRITIPNGELANGKIINYSVEDMRRLDLTFSVSYDDDIEKVKTILNKIITQHPLTFKEPEPVIRMNAYGESSIDFTVKVWCNRTDYWGIYYDLQEQVKLGFDAENITIPFQQIDVKMTH